MSKKLENYLRVHRKRSGLSQDDVAFLLGSTSGAIVSRYESFMRAPALRTALRLAAIYRVPVGELFAGLQARETIRAMLKARALVSGLAADDADRRAVRKVATLRAIAVSARNVP